MGDIYSELLLVCNGHVQAFLTLSDSESLVPSGLSTVKTAPVNLFVRVTPNASPSAPLSDNKTNEERRTVVFLTATDLPLEPLRVPLLRRGTVLLQAREQVGLELIGPAQAADVRPVSHMHTWCS